MRFRSLVPLVALVLLGVWLAAAPPARAAGAPATTALEAGPFLRADAVAVAEVTEVTDVQAPGGAPGRQVVRVHVQRAFKGTVAAGDDVTVMVLGQRPTLDPQRPSVPYFRKGARARVVLFLGQAHGRATFQLQTLFDAAGAVGDEQVAAVAAVAQWAREEDADAKARRTLQGLMEMLRTRGVWLPQHASRELAYLAQVRPQAFDRATTSQVQRTVSLATDADVRFWLRRAVDVLQQAAAAPAGRAPPRAQDPWRATFEAAPVAEDRRLLLGRVLAARAPGFEEHAWWAWVRLEPSGRTWFLGELERQGLREACPRLRDLYGPEEDGEVREALVRAVGRLGSDADVPWLVERAANPALRRTALLALARVRTGDALVFLAAAEREAEGDVRRWIAYLRSDAFVKDDAPARGR